MYKFLSFFLALMVSFSLFAAEGKKEKNKIVSLTSQNIEQVLKENKFVIVDVYAEWCGPCKLLAPIFKALNKELGSQYKFAKLNGDDEKDLLTRFNIESYPTILFFKDGNEMGRHVGLMTKNDFKEKIKQYLSE